MVAGSSKLALQDFLETVWPDSGNEARVVDAVITLVTHLCEEDTVPWPLCEEDATDDKLLLLLPGREADLYGRGPRCLGDFGNMVLIHLWKIYGGLSWQASDSPAGEAEAGAVGGGVEVEVEVEVEEVVVGGGEGLRDSAVTNDALAVSGLEAP